MIAQRTVLRLAFAEQITYARNEGLRTPKTTLPFKVLEGFLPKEDNGGETGIRTLGPLAGTTVFETAPFDHSGTSPRGMGVV